MMSAAIRLLPRSIPIDVNPCSLVENSLFPKSGNTQVGAPKSDPITEAASLGPPEIGVFPCILPANQGSAPRDEFATDCTHQDLGGSNERAIEFDPLSGSMRSASRFAHSIHASLALFPDSVVLCLVIIENGGNNGENQWQLERHLADHSLSPNDREKSAIPPSYSIMTRHRLDAAAQSPRHQESYWRPSRRSRPRHGAVLPLFKSTLTECVLSDLAENLA
jgi:hypothetical protein